MIQTGEQKLYTATEVSLLLGVTRETLGLYAKEAKIPDRRILRVRYYTEEEIRKVLETQGRKPTRRRPHSISLPENNNQRIKERNL